MYSNNNDFLEMNIQSNIECNLNKIWLKIKFIQFSSSILSKSKKQPNLLVISTMRLVHEQLTIVKLNDGSKNLANHSPLFEN